MPFEALAPFDRGPRQGRYRLCQATAAQDRDEALALRARVFRNGGCDSDRFDGVARHLLLRDYARGGISVATCRVLLHASGAAAARGYAGQSYDLTRLRGLRAPLVELGRVCLDPGSRSNPDVTRLLLGGITALVDSCGARFLFGCSSFTGADPQRHAQSLAWLAQHHAPPASLAPGRRAPETAPLPRFTPDPSLARAGLPPLLRSYMALGGWVSDHAVIDRDLDTLHIFTAVDVGTIPDRRKARLRASA